MSRRSRTEIVELIRATMPWEDVSEQSLSPKVAEIYRHRKQALEMYMDGSAIEEITHKTSIDSSYLKRMIKRCLTVAADGLVYGYRALLSHTAIKNYKRTKQVNTSFWQSGAGLAGLLRATFVRYPDIEPILKALIMKKNQKGKNKKVKEFAIKAKDLHVAFIDILNEKEHPKTEWPFNTKHRGLRSLSDYLRKVREENYENTVHILGDSGAIAHIPVGTGYSSLTKSAGLMEIIEIDSHTFDAIFILTLQHEYGLETYHVLKRLHLLAAVESLTSSVLWYYVVRGDDVTAEDVVALIRQMLSFELPKPEFTIKNLKLYPGAGFPADLIPEMTQVLPSIIRLDNALVNLGNKVSREIRKQLGCVTEFGVPGRPERRPIIEHTFKLFTEDLIQRFPNTTGSGPGKGRAVDPALAGCKFRITSDELDELAYSYFANLNAMPSEALRSLSPLEAISQLVKKNHYIPRRPPLDLQKTLGLVTERIIRTVKGGVDDGHRPYVTIERARYTSPRLIDSPELIGEKLIIEVNGADMRVVNAFLESGSPIGPLTVQGDWAIWPHSLKTRKEINSAIYKRTLVRTEGASIVATYFRHLEANLEAAMARNKQDRSSASKLDRLKSEQSRNSSNDEHSVEAAVPQATAFPSARDAMPVPDRDYLVPTISLDLIELVKKL